MSESKEENENEKETRKEPYDELQQVQTFMGVQRKEEIQQEIPTIRQLPFLQE